MLLFAVIAVAVVYTVIQRTLLDFRAGHMDEYDYLFVGKSLLNGLDWPTHTYIFGANFSWYLFAAADQWLGGLRGARSLAAVFGAASLAGVYWFARALWQSHRTALCATLLMAVHSSHIFTSKIATYDAISFALFTLALAPLLYSVRSSKGKTGALGQVIFAAAGASLLLVAVLAKYTTFAYVLLIAAALLYYSLRSFIVFCAVMVAGLTLYVSIHWVDLQVLYKVQISGTHVANATYREILSRSLNHTWLLLVPSILALIVARRLPAAQAGAWRIIVALLLFSLPLFLYHLHGRNLISLYKHLTYTNLFLSCATAWLIMHWVRARAQLTYPVHRYRWWILSVCMALYIAINHVQLQQTQRGYPDVTHLLAQVSIEKMNGRILSEDPYLFRYLKYGELAQAQIRETTWLDNDLDGDHTVDDVKDAIWDRKFDHVLLTDAIHPALNTTLRNIMQLRGYQLQFQQNYLLSPIMTAHTRGTISLYSLSDPVAVEINQ